MILNKNPFRSFEKWLLNDILFWGREERERDREMMTL
jgi:hypothetical protein